MSKQRTGVIDRLLRRRDRAEGNQCLLIAEAGVNHDGRVDRAIELVEVAAAAGADAVKFQVFRAETLVSPSAPKAGYQVRTTGSGESQFEMLKRLELSFDAFAKLKDHCVGSNIEFLATPFDRESADFLDTLGVCAFKVGSGDLTNLELLRHIAAKGRPMLVSTGMSQLGDVEVAVAAIDERGCVDLALLHCVSSYPALPDEINLAAMDTLRTAFRVPVGYSDHTMGTSIALAAVARGADILEKHFTLDPSSPGPDHRISLPPEELKGLVRDVRSIERAIGNGVKRPTEGELEVARAARRSIVASQDLPRGSILTDEVLELRRPGTGISASEKKYVLGRELKRALKKGALLSFEDLR